jgi:hypothetical protein
VLEAISALRELQAEGLILHVGITGPSFPFLSPSISSPHPPFPHSTRTRTQQVYPSRPSCAPRSSCYAAQAAP